MMIPRLTLSTDASTYSVTKCKNEWCSCENSNFNLCKDDNCELFKENKDEFEESDNNYEELAKNPIKKLSIWETILQESEEKLRPLYEWLRDNKESESEKESDHDDNPVNYLNAKIFPILLPAMEQMLIEACQRNVLENPKSQFNGLDYLAEYMWNKNPKHPERITNWTQLFNIPSFRRWLKQHPRPIYPKSWLWTDEQAALFIQRYVRGWIVRKRDDVQELRQFWKALAAEKSVSRIDSIQSATDERTISTTLIPEKLQELNICNRYKSLVKYFTKHR